MLQIGILKLSAIALLVHVLLRAASCGGNNGPTRSLRGVVPPGEAGAVDRDGDAPGVCPADDEVGARGFMLLNCMFVEFCKMHSYTDK